VIDVRPVIFINGCLLFILGGAMLVPAGLDVAYGNGGWWVFLSAALISAFVGGLMILSYWQDRRLSLNGRQAFLLASSAWVCLSLVGGLPFHFTGAHLTVTDAVFEAISGLTTTGSTVMTNLDHQPRDILLWRALLNWLGGLGFLIMAVAVLPLLRIGGMQMFKMESSDVTDTLPSRLSNVAWSVAGLYGVFTILGGLALWMTGLNAFEAVCYAFSTLSTGGFAISDHALSRYEPETLWVCCALMALGASPFIQHLNIWRSRRWAFLSDSQSHWYLSFMGFFALLLAFWLWAVQDMDGDFALTQAAFHVVSVVTSTGLVADDLTLWGGFAQVTFFILLFIGGCTGSAAGGVKIFRWEVLFKLSGIHLKRQLHPHGVFPVHFNQAVLSRQVVHSILGFMILYMLTFALFALALCAQGLDMLTAFSGSAAALSNIAHGLGPVIGPMGSYAGLPNGAKWLLCAEMLLGRLELLSVVALCSRAFWRE